MKKLDEEQVKSIYPNVLMRGWGIKIENNEIILVSNVSKMNFSWSSKYKCWSICEKIG